MGELLTGPWGEGVKAAVLSPYPTDTINGVPIVVGGVSIIASEQNDFLNSHGFESTLAVPRTNWGSNGWWAKDTMSLGLAKHVEPTRVRTDAWWSLSDPREIRKILDLSKRKLVIAHEPAMTMPAFSVAALSKVLHSVYPDSIVMSVHHAKQTREHLRKFYLADAAQNAFKLIDVPIVNTSEMKRLYESVLKTKFEVVENPVDTSRFRPDGPKFKEYRGINFEDDSVVHILNLGRIEERKGWPDVLATVEYMESHQDVGMPTNYEIIFAGSGPEAELLREEIAERRLGHKVKMLGFIPEEDKAALINSADFCIAPATRDESFGDWPLEAWSSGKALVAGRAFSPDLVKHGKDGNGFLLTTSNPSEAAFYYSELI